MTSDMSQYYDALKKADAAGDTAAATKLTSFIKQKQTPAPAATPPDNGILATREKQRGDIESQYEKGDIGKVGRGVLLAGSAAGEIGDVVGAGIKSTAQALTPTLANKVGEAAEAIGKTAPVQYTAQQYEHLKQLHPQLAEYLGAAGNIASVFPGAGMVEGAGKAAVSGVQKVGEAAKDIAKGAGGIDASGIRSSIDSLGGQATAKYAEADKLGGGLHPAAAKDVADSISGVLPKGGNLDKMTIADQKEAPKTFAAIQDIKNDFSQGNTGIVNLEKHRRLLNNVIYDSAATMTDKHFAQKAIDQIDKHLLPGGLEAEHFVNKGAETADAITQARQITAKKKSLEKLAPIAEIDDAKKRITALKSFVKKSKNMVGFRPEEAKAIRAAAKSGTTDKILSMLSGLASVHNIGPAALTGLAVGASRGAGEGAEAALAVGGAGLGARAGRDALRDARFMKAYEAVQNRDLSRGAQGPARSRQIVPQPPQQQLMLPAPNRMSSLPMSDREIAMARARNESMGQQHPTTPSVIYGRQQALNSALRSALLSGDSEGAARIRKQIEMMLGQ